MKKPFGAKAHCLIDYGFVALQALGPIALGLSRKTTCRAQLMGAGVLAYSLLTRSPVAARPVIPFKTHQWFDYTALTALAVTAAAAPDVRHDRKALAFHLGLLVLGITAVSLTDWNRQNA